MKHFVLFILLFAFALPVSAFAGNENSQTTTEYDGPAKYDGPPEYEELKDPLPDKPFDWNSLPPELRTTKEEMEAEAMEVYGYCSNNGYQKSIYSCECVSGSFLQMREFAGPAPSTGRLMEKVYSVNNPNCADLVLIEDNAMRNCMTAREVFDELATDNEDYCRCVAQTVAAKFKTNPNPQPAYMSAVNTEANTLCYDPAKRPGKPVPKTEDPLGVKIPQQ